jgi:D-beta-D-heptose 7-phosphate kinase/D-beta-D-heptose 1-phosphate adenosyltransferase
MPQDGELALDIDLLRTARVLCIGDVMLDRYVYGEVGRLSPEAPVPVLNIDSETHNLGGAGNVLRNLATLGAQMSFVSVVGNDDAGREIQNLLAELDGAEIHVLVQPLRKTTVKTRFIAVNQHLLRADQESAIPLGPYIRDDLLRLARELVTNHDVVVISDYAKGVLTDGVALDPPALADGYDPGGTEDAAVAALAVGIGAGLSLPHAAELASFAVGIVAAKTGTAVASAGELAAALASTAHSEPGETAALGVEVAPQPRRRGQRKA